MFGWARIVNFKNYKETRVLFTKGDMTGLLTDISFMYAHLRLRNYWTKKYMFSSYFLNSLLSWAGIFSTKQRESLIQTYIKMIYDYFKII